MDENNDQQQGQEVEGCSSPAATLLLVIGEPHSDSHKALILGEIRKGMQVIILFS